MRRIILLVTFILAFNWVADAQIIVKGYVRAASNNDPMIGAFITIKGLNMAGVAEIDGSYTIIVPTPSEPQNIIISVNHLGFLEKQEVMELLPIDDGETILKDFLLELDPLTLKDVIVTANKVEEELQNVPIAVSVLDAANLESRTVSTTEEALETVPNLMFDEWAPSRPSVALRGLWTGTANTGFEHSVGFYIDDVFQSRAFGINSTLMDIERVEVLRGPQGTLFGKNTIGGLLNLITEKPKFGKYASVELNGGNFNYFQGRAKGNIELIEDKLAVRVTGAVRKRDGWLEMDNPKVDDENGVQYYGGRLSLRYRPSDNIDWVFRGGFSNDDKGDITTEYRTPASGVDRLSIQDVEKDPNDRRGYNNEEATGFTRRGYQLSSHLNVKLGKLHTLTAITSYYDNESNLDRDFDNTSANATFYGRIGKMNNFSQEIRISTPRENQKFFYLAGLYFLKDNVVNDDSLALKGDMANVWKIALNNPNLPIDPETYFEYVNIDGDIKSNNYAAYLSMSYEILERVRLNAGLRYTIEDKSIAYTQAPFSPFGITQQLVAKPLGVDDPIRRDVTDRVFSGNFGLDFRTSDRTLIYINFSRGFKGSGFNVTFNPDESLEKAALLYKPEFVNSYEFGIKLKAGNRYLFNAAAFITDYRDKQETAAAGTSVFVANAEAIQGQGFEAEFTGIWNQFFKTDISASLLNLKYLDFNFTNPFTPIPTDSINLSGNRAPKAPVATLKFSPEFHFPLGKELRMLVRADYNYMSKSYNDIFNRDNIAREGKGRLNARITIATANQRVKLSLWGRNLTDEVVYVHGNTFVFGDFVALNPPRTLGLELRLNFYQK